MFIIVLMLTDHKPCIVSGHNVYAFDNVVLMESFSYSLLYLASEEMTPY